jgi:hypothetical protein
MLAPGRVVFGCRKLPGTPGHKHLDRTKYRQGHYIHPVRSCLAQSRKLSASLKNGSRQRNLARELSPRGMEPQELGLPRVALGTMMQKWDAGWTSGRSTSRARRNTLPAAQQTSRGLDHPEVGTKEQPPELVICGR